MRLFKPPSLRSFLPAALVGALSLIPAASVIAQSPPAGDLTVTVEEQENGGVKFSLSGTAYMQSSFSGMSVTNRTDNRETPPADPDAGGSYALPVGLTLTMPGNGNASEIEAPEEGMPVNEIYSLNSVGFNGNWELGYFSGGSLSWGDSITGAGSVTTNSVPFSWFVPGTFLVSPGVDSSSPEGGIYPYSITYKVIPFVRNPSLTLSKPGAFPKTFLRKSGRAQRVVIKNNGGVALTGLNLSIAGSGARDFSSSTLPRRELAPGDSTAVDVSFRPKRKGTRAATFTVKGLYTPPQPEPGISPPGEPFPFRFGPMLGQPEPTIAPPMEGAPGDEMIEAPAPVEVSDSTQLIGKGIVMPKPKPRHNSPRSVLRPR